jgi:hypothetical protein
MGTMMSCLTRVLELFRGSLLGQPQYAEGHIKVSIMRQQCPSS